MEARLSEKLKVSVCAGGGVLGFFVKGKNFPDIFHTLPWMDYKQKRAKPMNEDICVPDSLEATAADLAVPYKGGVKGRGHDSKSSKQRRFSPPQPGH